ncbi:peptidoglycan-binding protein [Haladaptatus pallidirubidus]|uniref:Mannosyl-glycoprotein endo-beta-N-acetylglucosamidase-like domain-containing protein n=1 Tax=Haladaptatus pallidirubidus TaxID=1008152 RepID=A0AAV3UDQ7_9EURY|nr:peptidoglycan-binding protein [Haladaptatus pallidirubidus]
MKQSRRTFLRGATASIATIGGIGALSGTSVAARYSIDSDLTNTEDISGGDLDYAIRQVRSDSPLIGLGSTWVDVSYQEGINPVYMAAHAAWESAWGTSNIARDKNNIYGWKAYDSCPYSCAESFSSKSQCIRTVMPVIRDEYLTPGGDHYYSSYGPTLRGMNQDYATDISWAEGIRDVMNSLADHITFGDDPGGYSWPIYSNGDQGEAVYTIQYLLEQHGYNLNYHDGIYGSEVTNTVQSFQSANGLSVDGVVGPNTWSQLVVTVQDANNDPYWATYAAQHQLRYDEGYSIAVDGVYGPETRSAIESFQSSAGLAVDGIVGPNTWQALVDIGN